MNRLRVFAVLVIILPFVGCGGSDNSQTESFSDIPEESETNLEVNPVPLLVIAYSVESISTWSSAFEATRSERESFKLTDLGFLASLDDPRRISVILRTNNHEESEKYLHSTEFAESLKQFGVVGEPVISHLDALKLPEQPVTQRYRMMITHMVEDYDQWKEIFDEHEPERIDAGLELVGIARNSEEPNLVSILFAFDDMDAAKIFASSDELKTAMQESGVVSEPVLSWFEKAVNN